VQTDDRYYIQNSSKKVRTIILRHRGICSMSLFFKELCVDDNFLNALFISLVIDVIHLVCKYMWRRIMKEKV